MEQAIGYFAHAANGLTISSEAGKKLVEERDEYRYRMQQLEAKNEELSKENIELKNELSEEMASFFVLEHEYEDAKQNADKLAHAIARFLDIDIGEATLNNDPWANALKAIEHRTVQDNNLKSTSVGTVSMMMDKNYVTPKNDKWNG